MGNNQGWINSGGARNTQNKSLRVIGTPSVGGNPSITSVTGTLADGGTLNITGSNLGSPPPGQFLDRFTNIAEYSGLTDGTTVPTGAGHLWHDVSGNSLNSEVLPVVSTTLVRGAQTHGYRCAGYSYLGNPTAWSYAPNIYNNKKIYLSWWHKMNRSPNEFGGSNKFTRIWQDDDNTAHCSWTQLQAYILATSSTTAFDDYPFVANQWDRLEVEIDLGASPKGHAAFFVNGVLRFPGYCNVPANEGTYSIDDITDPGNSFGFTPMIFGFDVGGTPTGGAASYNSVFILNLTDIYVSTGKARYEIATQSTWAAARGKGEVCEWIAGNNTSAAIKVTKGLISSLGSAYLYAIADDGSVNTNGYSLSGV